MSQRKTQTPAYWQEQFSVSDQDLELIYNKILEENSLLSLDQIAITFVQRHCEAEEREARSELQQGKLYQPDKSYEVGDQVVFPLFEYAVGTVEHTRAGHHPEYGTFTVIGVSFEKSSDVHEFATDLKYPHTLNTGLQSLANLQGLMTSEELYEAYGDVIRPTVKTALDENNDFIEFHDQYFLNGLLADFHEGLFNIADAAIDINNGPLGVDALIDQMGLNEGEITDLLRFSVNYRLHSDERFDDVGPTSEVMWYLERLEPPEAHHPPRRLQISKQSYDTGSFDDDLRKLLAEIDDEGTNPDEIAAVGPDINRGTVVLNYPHWRVGTLPLTPKTQSFFPSSHYNPVLFEFVDGRTGNTFPGWTVYNSNYVFGLGEWYKKNKLPVGAYIDIKRTDNPMRVIVEYQAARSQRDWVRMGTAVKNKLSFQMNTAAFGCKYDDLMIIGDTNQADIDELWLNAEEKAFSVYDLLCKVFPELSKLNPQSTVHAKTLYSAINVVRRVSPGVVFQELTTHECFIPINHGYWTYDPEKRD